MLYEVITPGNVDLVLRHVDVVEEVLPHEPVVAVHAFRVHGDVLVQIESYNFV